MAAFYVGWSILQDKIGIHDPVAIAVVVCGFTPFLIWSLVDFRLGLLFTIISAPLLQAPIIPHSFTSGFGDLFAISTIFGFLLSHRKFSLHKLFCKLWRNEYIFLVLIILSAILSLIFSGNNSFPLTERYGVAEIAGLITMMAFMAILVCEISRGGYIEFVLKSCAVSLGVVVASAFLGLPNAFFCINGYGSSDSWSVNGALNSSFGNPSYFGAYVAAIMPLLLWKFHSEIAGRGQRLAFFTIIVLMAVLVLLTLSRSALVGLAVSMAGFALVARFQNMSYILILVIAALISMYSMFWSVSVNSCRLHSGPAAQEVGARKSLLVANLDGTPELDGGMQVRLKLAENAFHAWQMHPFTGVGIGLLANYSNVGGIPNRAHNIFLTVLAEQGLLGIIAWSFWVGGLMFAIIRSLRSGKYDLEIKLLALALFSVFIQGLAMDYYRMTWIWVVFALVLSAPDWSREKKNRQ